MDHKKGKPMKRRVALRATLFAGLSIFLYTQTCLAQTTGTITVTGSNPTAVSATNTSDSNLSATIALGTLTPATGSALAAGTVQVRLRSNKAYTLSAQATALNFSSPDAADGGSAIALSDIGFGVTAIDATGTNVATGHTDTIVAGSPSFDYRSGWPAVSNGLTPFVAGTHATLNNISANTQVLSGSRISSKGNISTNNNYVLVTFGLATLPQYFTPNSGFSSTITITVAAP
jgi:hypothetical protein